MDKQRCQGKRRQSRRGVWGTFPCGRRAKGSVETQVGFTEHRACCGGDDCIGSIAGGYPAQFTAFSASQP